MEFSAILKKCAARAALTDAECQFLSDYQVPAADANLSRQNRELQKRVRELEERDLSEVERVRKQFESELAESKAALTALSAERDQAKDALSDLRYRQQISQLAQERHFTDPDYLAYLCRQSQLDLNDPGKVAAFMTEMQGKAPRLFQLALQPGPGNPPSPEPSGAASANNNDIASLLAEAPEV